MTEYFQAYAMQRNNKISSVFEVKCFLVWKRYVALIENKLNKIRAKRDDNLEKVTIVEIIWKFWIHKRNKFGKRNVHMVIRYLLKKSTMLDRWHWLFFPTPTYLKFFLLFIIYSLFLFFLLFLIKFRSSSIMRWRKIECQT